MLKSILFMSQNNITTLSYVHAINSNNRQLSKLIQWYYLPNGHWLLKWSVEQLGNHIVLNLCIILN